MQIVVFGANGHVGRLVVEKLLHDEHVVRAFVHSGSNFDKHPHLQVIKGDVRDPAAVAAAIKDAEVVVSCLGSWGTKSKDILVAGMRTIIPAMQSLKVKRLVSLTGAGARSPGDRPTLLGRFSCWGIRIFAPKIVQDGEQHIEMLIKSKLDWTVVRSPVMRGSSHQRGYKLSRRMPGPWRTIAREDVADGMVELTTNKEWRQAAPYIC